NPDGNDPNFGKDTVIKVRYINDRLKAGEVKFFTEDGTEMPDPFFKTTQLSPATRTFYAEILGERTNDFTVTIVPPIATQFEEVVYPVVFHLVTTENLDNYGFGIPVENIE